MSERDVVLEIIGHALDKRDVDGLALWLLTPRPRDGQTPAELLAAGRYGEARLLAVCTTAGEDARRRAKRHQTIAPACPACAAGHASTEDHACALGGNGR